MVVKLHVRECEEEGLHESDNGTGLHRQQCTRRNRCDTVNIIVLDIEPTYFITFSFIFPIVVIGLVKLKMLLHKLLLSFIFNIGYLGAPAANLISG